MIFRPGDLAQRAEPGAVADAVWSTPSRPCSIVGRFSDGDLCLVLSSAVRDGPYAHVLVLTSRGAVGWIACFLIEAA